MKQFAISKELLHTIREMLVQSTLLIRSCFKLVKINLGTAPHEPITMGITSTLDTGSICFINGTVGV